MISISTMPGRTDRRGFTLLEVLFALAILALATTLLLAVQNEAIETDGDARELRRLRLLGSWKMEEILSGVEEGRSGSFRDADLREFGDGDTYAEYRWEVRKETITITGDRKDPRTESVTGTGSVTAELVTLTVTSPSGRALKISGLLYEEAEREEESDG